MSSEKRLAKKDGRTLVNNQGKFIKIHDAEGKVIGDHDLPKYATASGLPINDQEKDLLP
jgi:hypothetical protein